MNLHHDRYSDFGGADGYYAGYNLTFNPQWKTVASASSVFCAFSSNELYYPLFGSPNIRLEKARSMEGSVRYNGAIGLTRMTVFKTGYGNLITAVRDADFNCSVANVNRARVNRLETSCRGSIYDVDLHVSFTIQSP